MGPFAMSDLAGLDIGWNKETSNGETPGMFFVKQVDWVKNQEKDLSYDENRNKSPDLKSKK